NRAQIGMIERMIERVAIVIFASRTQVFFTRGAKEPFDSLLAEIEFTGPRTPVMERQLAPLHFPFLGKLLPEPTECTGHCDAMISNLHPFAHLLGLQQLLGLVGRFDLYFADTLRIAVVAIGLLIRGN